MSFGFSLRIYYLYTNVNFIIHLSLAFQSPPSIPGVPNELFLRTAYKARFPPPEGQPFNTAEFEKKLKKAQEQLKMDDSFLQRGVNEGFSGGEKVCLIVLLLFSIHVVFL